MVCAHHDLELALELLDLVLRLDQVLAVDVAVRSHGLIQVLLLLESGLALTDLQGSKQCELSRLCVREKPHRNAILSI